MSFIGVYSTLEHPFALVFEFMEHRNLREYLRNNHDVGRRELVRFSSSFIPIAGLVSRHQLLVIAHAIKGMHNVNVVHGNLKIVRTFLCPRFSNALMFVQTNILIGAGGYVRTACPGTAFTSFTTSRMDVDRFSHGPKPKLINPRRFGSVNIEITKASDIYAFGVIAWEVSRLYANSSGQNTKRIGIILRFSLGESHSPIRVLLRECIRC